MTYLEELKEKDPKLHAAVVIVGAGSTQPTILRAMVTALKMCPRLNTAEDNQRLKAAQYILRRRKK